MDILNLKNEILLTDEDYNNKLQLFHYKNCTNDTDSYVKSIRGVVKNGDKIVSKSFGYIDEYDANKDENVIMNKIHSFNQCKIYKMYEGTVVRMFFWKHRWFLSTHKKLNAFDSKWGNSDCKTFGEMFIDSLCDPATGWIPVRDDIWDIYSNFCFSLNTNKTYVFLILHDDTTEMVCKLEKNTPSCFHIGEFDNVLNLLVEGNTSGLPSLPQLDFNNQNELLEYVKTLNIRINPGVIIYFPNQTQIKIYNSDYKKLQELRGNQPDIMYRYLELRNNKEKLNSFYYNFKEKESEFIDIESKIYETAKLIHSFYMSRYIYKQFVYVPKPEYIVIQLSHKWHLENRDENKVNVDKILEIINNLPIKKIYSLLKNY